MNFLKPPVLDEYPPVTECSFAEQSPEEQSEFELVMKTGIVGYSCPASEARHLCMARI